MIDAEKLTKDMLDSIFDDGSEFYQAVLADLQNITGRHGKPEKLSLRDQVVAYVARKVTERLKDDT